MGTYPADAIQIHSAINGSGINNPWIYGLKAKAKNGTHAVGIEGKGTAAALSKQARAVPDEFSLGANYPNPFRASAEIRFGLPEAADVRLAVYDVMGRRVATLVDKQMPPGFHRARFDASQLPASVYVYRLTAGSAFADTDRMVLAR